MVALGFASVTFSFRFSRTCSTTTRPSLIRQGIFAKYCKESVFVMCVCGGRGGGVREGYLLLSFQYHVQLACMAFSRTTFPTSRPLIFIN